MRSPPLAPAPARLLLGAAGRGRNRSARFPGIVTLTVLWQVSTGARPRTAFLEKLPGRRSSAARRAPSPVAQDCGQRAADAPGSFCKLPPPRRCTSRRRRVCKGAVLSLELTAPHAGLGRSSMRALHPQPHRATAYTNHLQAVLNNASKWRVSPSSHLERLINIQILPLRTFLHLKAIPAA